MIKNIILTCIACISMQIFGQIGIGTTTPDRSSVLDVSSTDKGVLFPRMTTTQRNTIVNPAKGLTIYNLDENCLQVNSGSTSSPDWMCIGGFSSASVINNCDANGFESIYVNGVALTASNKFSITITNNSFNTANISFATNDLVLSGVSGISVNSVSPASATLTSGSSQVVEYELSGTPNSTGTLTGVWTKLGLSCTKHINVTNGDATFILPQTATIFSVNDGTPNVNIQGTINNTSNLLIVTIPYTGGIGTYAAYTGTYTPNNAGTSEGNDANSFRLSYPSGTFSSTGSITATVEVDGDGSFNAKKQLFAIQETIATLEFQVNGNSKGNVHLVATGGIPDRNFTDTDHKFIYTPVTAADGNIWLNNNLGANYTNLNHIEFNPTQQATSHNDYHAYGSLYQWGRYSDGHELINYTSTNTGARVNGTTATNATSDTPGHNLFITENFSPFDWLATQNNNLWQGETGTNNPCPQGYRLPTQTEINTLVSAEGITNNATAASSTLKLTAPGNVFNNGTLGNIGSSGQYWSRTTSGPLSNTRYIDNSTSSNDFNNRANGSSVRCIKD